MPDKPGFAAKRQYGAVAPEDMRSAKRSADPHKFLDSAYRTFHILQYINKPCMNHVCPLNYDETKVRQGCNSGNVIGRWAYILHNKDTYGQADVKQIAETYAVKVQAGQKKEPHYHIVLYCPSNVKARYVARWFGLYESAWTGVLDRYEYDTHVAVDRRGMYIGDIRSVKTGLPAVEPDKMDGLKDELFGEVEALLAGIITIPYGRNAFLDCVAYLTHSNVVQREAGKYVYADDEVKANFDWRQEVSPYQADEPSHSERVAPVEAMRMNVLRRLTLVDMERKYPAAYASNPSFFRKLRRQYVETQAPVPDTRINILIHSNQAGTCKTEAAKALARVLFPDKSDQETFALVGSGQRTFEGYDAQPVIIWDDFQAAQMLELTNGDKSRLYHILNAFPNGERILEHVKEADVCMLQSVNLITTSQFYEDFLDVLMAETEDSDEQIGRHIPFILSLTEQDMTLLASKGYLDKSQAFNCYIQYARIRGSFAHVLSSRDLKPDDKEMLRSRMIRPVGDRVQKIWNEYLAEYSCGNRDIPSEFSNYGDVADYGELQAMKCCNELLRERGALRTSYGIPYYFEVYEAMQAYKAEFGCVYGSQDDDPHHRHNGNPVYALGGDRISDASPYGGEPFYDWDPQSADFTAAIAFCEQVKCLIEAHRRGDAYDYTRNFFYEYGCESL